MEGNMEANQSVAKLILSGSEITFVNSRNITKELVSRNECYLNPISYECVLLNNVYKVVTR